MMDLKRQIRRLLAYEWVGFFSPAGSIWVLLLAGRGFSLAQIGLAEGVFHLTSILGEIPTGVCADLLGRRRTLAASRVLAMCSALALLLVPGVGGVLLHMALSALGYNLASGTREAITYDSLLQAGQERHYLRLAARQNICYRLTCAAATLCAGLVVAVGWRVGYALDLLFAAAGVCIALALKEPQTDAPPKWETTRREGFSVRLRAHLSASLAFLRANPRVGALMLFNALVGAAATLLGFYLQEALRGAGAPVPLLGPLLLLVGLGGAAGNWLAPHLGRLRYRCAALLCTGGVAMALLAAGSALYPLMALGGFCAALFDDALQTLTDARLNEGIASAQRATLLSVSSLCFSAVMVVLSPLLGALVG